MELSQFQENCNNKKCLKRQRWDSKTCIRTSKQTNCHKSYERLEAKKEISKSELSENQVETLQQLNDVWLRDSGQVFIDKKQENWKSICRLWRTLTEEEKQIFLEVNKDNLHLCQILDMAHVEAKSIRPDLKYLVENVVLMNRLSHSFIDFAKSPLTGENITNEERNNWWNRIVNGDRK